MAEGGETAGGGEGGGTKKKKKKKAAAPAAAPATPTAGSPKALEASRLSGAEPLTGSEQRAGVTRVPGATRQERSSFSASGLPPQQREALPGPNPDLQFTREALQKTGKYTPEAINELFEAVERVAPDIVGTPFNPNPEVSPELTEGALARGGGGDPTIPEILRGEGELGHPALQEGASFWDKLDLGMRAVPVPVGSSIKGALGFKASLNTSRNITATQGLSAPRVAESAAGFRKRILTGIAKPEGFSTKTARQMWGYMAKITARAKKPDVVLAMIGTGIYTSLFWAPNEKGDAMTTASIAQREALRNEDYEAVLEIGETIREANEIQATLPVSGFWKAEKAKFKASVQASETYEKAAEKAVGKAKETEGLSPSQL